MTRSEKLSIVTAAIIGDGHARGRKLTIEHSNRQVDYADYKAKLISQATGRPCTKKSVVSNGYSHVRYYFATSEIVERVANKIYVEGKKRLSVGLLNQLDARGLAIWYMDDGSLTIHKYKNGTVKSREIYWSTECFSFDEHEILIGWLRRRFDLNAKIASYRKKTKLYWRIKFNATEANKLFRIIDPYIHESMRYKTDMRYASGKSSRRCARPLSGENHEG